MRRFKILKASPGDVWLRKKGRWKGAKEEGERTALVSCPGCGIVASLSRHEIAYNGEVDPSLACPECPFHEFVTLVGWKS